MKCGRQRNREILGRVSLRARGPRFANGERLASYLRLHHLKHLVVYMTNYLRFVTTMYGITVRRYAMARQNGCCGGSRQAGGSFGTHVMKIARVLETPLD